MRVKRGRVKGEGAGLTCLDTATTRTRTRTTTTVVVVVGVNEAKVMISSKPEVLGKWIGWNCGIK